MVSADILHKSDIGGVVLNLNSAAEVKKAFNDITARVKKLKNKPKLEGILIAQQVKADLELVVGASLDAEMGPVVLFGTGGVDIELMKDVALAGAPLDAAEAKELIGRTKAGVKLKGYRGKPALHEASVVKAIVGLSNLMADAGTRIASIDVNPFLINTKTGVAVDGLIVLNNAAANLPREIPAFEPSRLTADVSRHARQAQSRPAGLHHGANRRGRHLCRTRSAHQSAGAFSAQPRPASGSTTIRSSWRTTRAISSAAARASAPGFISPASIRS